MKPIEQYTIQDATNLLREKIEKANNNKIIASEKKVQRMENQICNLKKELEKCKKHIKIERKYEVELNELLKKEKTIYFLSELLLNKKIFNNKEEINNYLENENEQLKLINECLVPEDFRYNILHTKTTMKNNNIDIYDYIDFLKNKDILKSMDVFCIKNEINGFSYSKIGDMLNKTDLRVIFILRKACYIMLQENNIKMYKEGI